jgi:sec-independent protein translocase protein TatC
MPLLRRKTDEDLFRESTMTFGQHLEELRVCLFRAVLGLFLGTLAGFAVGRYMVDFIKFPLEKALRQYHQNHAVEKVSQQLQQLREAGYVLPADESAIRDYLVNEGLTCEEVYINVHELQHHLDAARKGEIALPGPAAASAPAVASASAAAEAAPDPNANFAKIFLWRKVADDPRTHVKSLQTQEPFMIYVKASLLVGAILSSPWVFYQLWTFVAAGLYRHERRYVHIFLPFSVGLFLAGVALAFTLVFEPVLTFLFQFNDWLGIEPDPRINEWLGFVLLLPLGFGISFQLPLVMLFLERIGIFSVQSYLSYWRVAVLVIFVAAMVLTPSGDPYSMLLMAGPLVILYFGGVGLCKLMPRGRRRAADFTG